MCEDMNPKAMPKITDASAVTVQGAYKYSQIGPDAATKVLAGLFENAEIPPRALIEIIDINPDVGCFFNAFLTMSAQSTFAVRYTNICHDDVQSEWLLSIKKDLVADEFQSGKLIVNGFTPLGDQPPLEHFEKAPELPDLKLCSWHKTASTTENDKYVLCLPTGTYQSWFHHDTYSDEFGKCIGEITQDMGSLMVLLGN